MARENAARKTVPLPPRGKVVREPARGKAVAQAAAPDGAGVKAGAPDRAVEGSPNILTNQPQMKEVLSCQDLTKQDPWAPAP